MTSTGRERLAGRAVDLAPRLLGWLLTSSSPDGAVTVALTELEAYEGVDDPASHGFRGPTRRNAVMFGPAGHLYCYFSYGLHWCANVVCGPPGVCSALLLRAGAVVEGADLAASRRPSARQPRDLARGPARLTSALGIGGEADGRDLLDPAGCLRLRPGPPRGAVRQGPRVGISTAEDRPWRFWVDGDDTVSTYRRGARRRPAAETRPT